MSQPILAWINCYGAWAPDLRDPVETIGYSQYLDSVADALLPLKERLGMESRSVHLKKKPKHV